MQKTSPAFLQGLAKKITLGLSCTVFVEKQIEEGGVEKYN